METCKWCEKELNTMELGGDEYNGCWQLRTAIERDVVLANKILKSIILQGVS